MHAYEDLTTDIGKTYVEAFAAANQVIVPPIDAALNYAPGISTAYQTATAASGSTIFGEQLSPGERALTGAFAIAGVVPVGKASGVVEAAKAEGKRVVVIGETMRDRVVPFAESIGADWYKARSTIPENWMKNNERWIKQLIKEGAVIIDIGEDAARAIRSEYYAMERRILEAAGYGVVKVVK